MKRKIPALLLALLLVFSAALPAGAATYRCAVRSWPPDCWKQFFCDRFGIGCGNQTPGAPSEPEQPSEPEEPSEPEQPSEPSGGASVSSYEQQVAALVNAERAKYGLAALTRVSAAMPASNRRTCSKMVTSRMKARPMAPRST